MPKIVTPGRNRSLFDKFLRPTQLFNAWMQTVSEASQTLTGATSPEGVVDGFIGQNYLDTVAGTFYKKSTDGGDTGWKALN